ncbi:unnamed protein product [Hymenolepis diminuta]|uniref:Uncharacterized protein n=1 Tax=Hymenolepis diminuta TaxID=6216 RepID=A0A564Z2D2_HYMDI|nr:unnamed protein product [Hymenolepis diminuta]
MFLPHLNLRLPIIPLKIQLRLWLYLSLLGYFLLRLIEAANDGIKFHLPVRDYVRSFKPKITHGTFNIPIYLTTRQIEHAA